MALLGAYDAGYSFDQIARGAEPGLVQSDGTIAGSDPESASGVPSAYEVVLAQSERLDLVALRAILATERAKLEAAGRDTGSVEVYMTFVAQAVGYGLPVEAIVEAIVLGDFTEETIAKIRESDNANDEVQYQRSLFEEELDWCRGVRRQSQTLGERWAGANYASLGACVLDVTGQPLTTFGLADDIAGSEEQNRNAEEKDVEAPLVADAVSADPVNINVAFSGVWVGDSALLGDVSWSVSLDDGYGEGQGTVSISGPCLSSSGQRIADMSGSLAFAIEAAEDTGALVLMSSSFEVTEFSEVLVPDIDEAVTCRDAFDLSANVLEGDLNTEADLSAEPGERPATIGSFAGTLTVIES